MVRSENIIEIFFFKNHAENEAGRPIPYLFFFFKKALHEIKASGPRLASVHFDTP